MSAGHGEKVGLRLFLEGVEVPVISARVTASVGGGADASIEVVPLDSVQYLVPCTVVHLFYLDYGSPTDSDSWKLLFYGELLAVNITQSGGGSRSASLSARDRSNILERTYLFSLTFSERDAQGSPTVIANRSAFYGTWSNPFGDTLNEPGQVVANLHRTRRHPTASYPIQPSGMMGGLLSIVEFALGIQGATRGANDYVTVGERRHRFLEQIGTDDGASAEELFTSTAFQEWLTNRMSSLGATVPLSAVLNLILGYTYHKHIPVPVARYHHGVRTPPTVTAPPPVATVPTTTSATPVTAAPLASLGASGLPAIRNNSTRTGLVPAKSSLVVGLDPLFLRWIEYLTYCLNARGIYNITLTDGKREEGSGPHRDGVAVDMAGGGGGGTGFDSRSVDTVYWFKTSKTETITLEDGKTKEVRPLSWNPTSGIESGLGPYPRAMWGLLQYPGTASLRELIGKPLTCAAHAPYSIKTSKTTYFHGPVPATIGQTGPNGYSARPLSESDVNILEQSAAFFAALRDTIRGNPHLSKNLFWGGDMNQVYKSQPGWKARIWVMYGVGADPVHVQLHSTGKSDPDLRKKYKFPTTEPPWGNTGSTQVVSAPAAPTAQLAPQPTTPAQRSSSPPVSTVSTPNTDTAERQRLLTTLYLPNVWMVPPPVCNLIFPSELNAVSFGRNFMAEATRVELEVHDAIIRDASASSLNINAVYYAPNLRDIRDPNGKPVESLTSVGFQTAASGNSGTPLVMDHEIHTGLIPRQATISDVAFNLSPQDVLPSGTSSGSEVGSIDDSTANATGISRIADWMLLESRFESRQCSGSTVFMPRLVPGLSATVFLRPDTLGLDTDKPIHWVGYLQSITHVISSDGASTSFSMTHCRSHRLESDPDDILLGRRALASQLAGGGLTKTVIDVASDRLAVPHLGFLRWLQDTYFPGFVPQPSLRNAVPGSSAWPTGTAQVDAPVRITPPSGSYGPTGKVISTILVHPISQADRVAAQNAAEAAGDPLGDEARAKFAGPVAGGLLDPGQVYFLGQMGGMEDVWVLTTSGKTFTASNNPLVGTEGDDTTISPTELSPTSTASPALAQAVADQQARQRAQIVGFSFSRVEVEEITGGVRQPLEQALRPPWMSESYANDRVGKEVYEPLIGCGSIIDKVQGTNVPGELTGHSTESALDAILKEYSAVSNGGYAAPAWVRGVTGRQTASLAQVLGSKASASDDIPGFHFYTSGDYGDLENLDLADKTGLLDPWTSEPIPTPVSKALDPRKSARARVRVYAGQLLAGRGYRG